MKNSKLVNLILKALAVAMGVSVTALANLHLLEAEACFTMLGIGLACVGVCLLGEKDGEKQSAEGLEK